MYIWTHSAAYTDVLTAVCQDLTKIFFIFYISLSMCAMCANALSSQVRKQRLTCAVLSVQCIVALFLNLRVIRWSSFLTPEVNPSVQKEVHFNWSTHRCVYMGTFMGQIFSLPYKLLTKTIVFFGKKGKNWNIVLMQTQKQIPSNINMV